MVRYGVFVPLPPLLTAVLIIIIILTLYITLTILVNRPKMCSEKQSYGMQQRILIPLDGSKVGEAAIPFVEKLISIMSPEVKVDVNLLGVLTGLKRWVVVGETMVLVTYTEEELGFIRKEVADNLEKTAATLRQQGITVNILVNTGDAAEEILKTANEIGADMIAMSTHGRSGLSRFAHGSVTDKVLRRAVIPVLVVRASVGTVNQKEKAAS